MPFHLTYKACTKLPLLLSSLLAIALACPIAVADERDDPPQFVEGVHYARLPLKAGADDSGKIEVREFFWYGCPHCYQLEPYLNSWKVADDVEFIRTPATLGRNWLTHAYVYYALEALGKADELHPLFFEALHAKKLKLQSITQIAQFFAAHGVDAAKFEKTANSFVVEAKVKQADKLARGYLLSSVPTVVVNGRYQLSPRTAGGYKKFTDALDYLVALERKRLGKRQP